MSTHNMCVCREIRKILCGYPLLSVAMFFDTPFIPEFLKWILQSLKLVRTIVSNRSLSQNQNRIAISINPNTSHLVRMCFVCKTNVLVCRVNVLVSLSLWAGLSGSVRCVCVCVCVRLVIRRSQVSLPICLATFFWRSLFMKHFQPSFCPSCWIMTGSCQVLAKECAKVLVNRLED